MRKIREGDLIVTKDDELCICLEKLEYGKGWWWGGCGEWFRCEVIFSRDPRIVGVKCAFVEAEDIKLVVKREEL